MTNMCNKGHFMRYTHSSLSTLGKELYILYIYSFYKAVVGPDF